MNTEQNTDSYEALVDRYAPLVLRLAWQTLGSREKSEEMACKVFAGLVRAGRAQCGDEDTRGYLARAVIRRCANRRAPAWQWHRAEEDTDWELSGREDRGSLVLSVVGLLPSECRYAVYFSCFEGCGAGEIAGLLGCSVPAVEKNLDKGRAMFKKLLKEDLEGANAESYRAAMTRAPTLTYACRMQILQAMERARRRPYLGAFRSRAAAWSAVAGALALVVLAGFLGARWWQGQNQYTPLSFPGGLCSEDPGYTSPDALPALPRPAGPVQALAVEPLGIVLVQDFAEQRSANPTLDNTDGLTRLPVYPNAPRTPDELRAAADAMAAALGTAVTQAGADASGGLGARCADGTAIAVTDTAVSVTLPTPLPLPARAGTLDEQAPCFYDQLSPLAGLRAPKLETSAGYDAEGTPRRTFAWFEDDPQQDPAARLLDYTFRRIGDAVWAGTETRSFSVPLWPASAGTLYPIRGYEAAQEALRAGRFTSDAAVDPASATILHSEIVYTGAGEDFLQPVYRFTVTQGSWDLSALIQAADPSRFTAVAYAYVPAVEEDYLQS